MAVAKMKKTETRTPTTLPDGRPRWETPATTVGDLLADLDHVTGLDLGESVDVCWWSTPPVRREVLQHGRIVEQTDPCEVSDRTGRPTVGDVVELPGDGRPRTAQAVRRAMEDWTAAERAHWRGFELGRSVEDLGPCSTVERLRVRLEKLPPATALRFPYRLRVVLAAGVTPIVAIDRRT